MCVCIVKGTVRGLKREEQNLGRHIPYIETRIHNNKPKKRRQTTFPYMREKGIFISASYVKKNKRPGHVFVNLGHTRFVSWDKKDTKYRAIVRVFLQPHSTTF